MILHITAPKQHLCVPGASWAFKLSFHSLPQSTLPSVLVCHLGRSQSHAMAVSDLPASWLIQQLQVPLAQSLASSGDWQLPSFPCLPLKLILSYPLTECIHLCLRFKWKSQVRLTDVQCDHVPGGQKILYNSVQKESRGNLAIWSFCLRDFHHFTVSYGTNSDSRCWSPRELLIWASFVLQDCFFKQTNWIKFFTKKRREREGHVL